MNNLTRLVIAVLLGGGAAATNMAWLQSQKAVPLYVAASANLADGELITAESLTAIPVPGDVDHIGKTFIPYSQRSILFGSKAQRSYRFGDLFVYRDIPAPTNRKPEYEYLGPFRIVGVGGAFKEKSLNDQRVGGSGRNITIAGGYENDANLERLLEVLESGTKIVAVQAIPADQVELTAQALKSIEHDNYVYQTISLNAEYDPTVLYNGAVIRLVLPKPTGY